MRGKATVRIMVVLVTVLFLSMSAWAQSSVKKAQTKRAAVNRQNACAKTTKAEIVAAIKAQFEADAEIKEQMSHVNISVKNRYVKLEGWLDGKALVEKAVALTKTVKCVKRVTSRLKESGGGSCGAGLKPCGGVCIERQSECILEN